MPAYADRMPYLYCIIVVRQNGTPSYPDHTIIYTRLPRIMINHLGLSETASIPIAKDNNIISISHYDITLLNG